MTLGHQQHRNRDAPGISWSMPPAHLRYHGGAVPSQRSLGLKTSNLSFDQIMLFTMGSTTSNWNNSNRTSNSEPCSRPERVWVAYDEF